MIQPRARLIAIDPGLRATGVAVADAGGRLLETAVWTVGESVGPRAAVRQLVGRFDQLVAGRAPGLLVVEETYPTRNPSLAPVHRVAQAFLHRARRRGVSTVVVSPASARRRLLGNGKAGKRDVGRFCATLYPELRVYLNQRERWRERHFGNLFDAVLLAVDALSRGAAVEAPHRTPRHRSRWFSLRLGPGAGRFLRRDPEARPRT
jgi:Holliday junction resolvasome RuvABC endonuclease subunit